MLNSLTGVYIGNAGSNTVSVLRLTQDGHFELIEEIDVPGASEASSLSLPLAVSPDRCFLYAALRSPPFPVSAFSIDPENGRLTCLATDILPYSTPFITTDRTGRYLLSASYHSGSVAVNAIDAEGAVVSPARQVIAAGPKMHCMAVDASNRHVYTACLGGDAIFRYEFDAQAGTLSPEPASVTRTAAMTGPRHLIIHPNGRALYAIGELDATITAYTLEPETGALREIQRISLLSADFRGTPSAADLHVSPDARFLYGSERTSSTIACFTIDESTAMLAPSASVKVERVPRAFAIDPLGHLLLVAGLNCNRLGVYAIGQNGGLSKISDHPTGLAPSWIEIIDLAAISPQPSHFPKTRL
jgi:6-phosphogluconolactonase